MKRFIQYIIVSLAVFALTACHKEFLRQGVTGDGKADISVTLDFKPMSSALTGTRAAGDALSDVSCLHVLLYDFDTKTLIKGWEIERYAVSDVGRSDENAEYGNSAETSTRRASFRLPERVDYGQYYMYAVANVSDLLTNKACSDAIQTVEGLKNLPVAWNSDNVAANGQMMGCLIPRITGLPIDDEPVTVDGNNTALHAWLRRAASKVTVAFDGSSLKDGVSIYLKALRIKNIPATCKLGADNKVEKKQNLIETGGEIIYTDSPLITKDRPYYPAVQQTGADGTVSWVEDPDRHSEDNAYTLFFYENMQGEGPDKRQIDKDKNGIIDEMFRYEEMEYATYIEADAYYESTDPVRPGICNITYRFMLGQDIIKDYNARRNSHYKLTLHFNGYADDPDWRTDYVTRLWATQPEPVDYQGKYFVPDENIANLGDDFREDNSITVTSFMFGTDDWATRKEQPYRIEYREAGSEDFTETRPNWLGEFTTTHLGNGVYNLKINYNNPYKEVKLDTAFRAEKTETYDLSTKGGTTKMNTANCYIVDAKGTYRFPLVYGCGVIDDVENSDSYTYRGWGGAETYRYLENFVNYKNADIGSPYILTDLGNPTGLTASLVWQDEPGLVTDIEYVSGGNGAIQFTVGEGIKEGNAVIALKDSGGTIIWSWHIWVTPMDLSRTLELTNYTGGKFEIMPVNLGWCSGGSPIRYYDRHECEVRFTQIIGEGQDGLSKTVRIVQEPHTAVPCGNNPYFQHGRKDPFVASGGANETTKKWYDASGNPSTKAPALMHDSSIADGKRTATYKSTAALIKNPHKWQNGPRVENDGSDETVKNSTQKYYPRDTVYVNLWDNSAWDDNDSVIKTVYDPCPAGYHVSSIYTFSGFSAVRDGGNAAAAENIFAATETNMLEKYRTGLYEFYTDKTKLVSIGFPQNGYRDWDADAEVYSTSNGNIWHAQAAPWSWSDILKFPQFYNAYNLEYVRSANSLKPANNFYATDGMAIRPALTK